jgi:hypothetical protein
LHQFVIAQSNDVIVNNFFQFTNEYKKESLENLLTDDFELTRTYSTYKNDKSSFLTNYLNYSQLLKGKFTVINRIHSNEKSIYLAVDSSLFYTLLDIPSPIWKFSFTILSNKITKIQIDTSDSYTNYLSVLQEKNNQFESWLQQKDLNNGMLTINSSSKLYLEKLEEYSIYRKTNGNKN